MKIYFEVNAESYKWIKSAFLQIMHFTCFFSYSSKNAIQYIFIAYLCHDFHIY